MGVYTFFFTCILYFVCIKFLNFSGEALITLTLFRNLAFDTLLVGIIMFGIVYLSFEFCEGIY